MAWAHFWAQSRILVSCCEGGASQISIALNALGPAGDEIQVLLVSVDPRRDTPAAMKAYTASFGPWLHGLTGSEQALRAVNQAYKVDFLAQTPDSRGRYEVAHSNRVFSYISSACAGESLSKIG